jgi:hypothetical protein
LGSILNRILQCSVGKVILTTRKASIGIDMLFDAIRAFVISTEDMSFLDELYQPFGRSSRLDPTLSLLGAVFTFMNCIDIESLI